MRSDELPVVEFATPGPIREWLVDLVVAGTKMATASLVAEWELDGETLSQPGNRWAVVRTDGTCACVIEITEVKVASFHDADATFHLDEGEGMPSREAWIVQHEAFWNEHVVPGVRRHLDPTFSLGPDTAVVFERFRLADAVGGA